MCLIDFFDNSDLEIVQLRYNFEKFAVKFTRRIILIYFANKHYIS